MKGLVTKKELLNHIDNYFKNTPNKVLIKRIKKLQKKHKADSNKFNKEGK